MVPLSGQMLARLDALAPEALVAVTAAMDAAATTAPPSLHWSTADEGVVDGWGATVTLDGVSLAALAPAARRTLAAITPLGDDAPPPRLYGGQCFDPARPPGDDPAWSRTPGARLVLPTWTRTAHRGRTLVQWTGTAAAARSLSWSLPDVVLARSPAVAAVRAADPGASDRWSALVREALAAMADGVAAKLVGARRVRWSKPDGWSLAEVLARLSAHDGGARFALTLAPDAVFVGATPERLVVRRGDAVEVDALAGSLPRTADDPAAVAALLSSAKDRHEHALVVTFVADALRSLGLAVTHDATPAVRSLPSVHHLWTPVRALAAPAPDALTLAAALHPTPAVAGAPRDAALRWIARHEPAPRGWYAGAVGWCDARGDGCFVVALRSAVLRGTDAWAYVGAGLVPGSDPTLEWRETEAKLRTARVALEGPA